jgi:RNA polymerase sigma-70 factor (ECF subfamily)
METVMTGISTLNQTATGPTETSDPADAALVLRCQNGDQHAFESLVTRYRGKIYAMIVNMTGNDADAWDLAQEVFLKAWRALPKFEARSSFYTWIYRITHNVTYDWMRKKKISPGMEFDDTLATPDIAAGAHTVPHSHTAPDAQLENRELGNEIKAALQELSPEHRSIILLKEIDGLSYQEIAESLDITMGTVMSRLFYARKKLQTLLQHLDPTKP